MIPQTRIAGSWERHMAYSGRAGQTHAYPVSIRTRYMSGERIRRRPVPA